LEAVIDGLTTPLLSLSLIRFSPQSREAAEESPAAASAAITDTDDDDDELDDEEEQEGLAL
jgi:hypothetical protein